MTGEQMRQAITAGIRGLTLGQFQVSQEMPWISGGIPLYEKNYRVFYVDEPESEEANLINTLCGGSGLTNRVTTISVFVTIDAKQKPVNYDDLVVSVQALRNTPTITGVRSRECDVIRTFEADALVTEFEFRFTELI